MQQQNTQFGDSLLRPHLQPHHQRQLRSLQYRQQHQETLQYRHQERNIWPGSRPNPGLSAVPSSSFHQRPQQLSQTVPYTQYHNASQQPVQVAQYYRVPPLHHSYQPNQARPRPQQPRSNFGYKSRQLMYQNYAARQQQQQQQMPAPAPVNPPQPGYGPGLYGSYGYYQHPYAAQSSPHRYHDPRIQRYRGSHPGAVGYPGFPSAERLRSAGGLPPEQHEKELRYEIHDIGLFLERRDSWMTGRKTPEGKEVLEPWSPLGPVSSAGAPPDGSDSTLGTTGKVAEPESQEVGGGPAASEAGKESPSPTSGDGSCWSEWIVWDECEDGTYSLNSDGVQHTFSDGASVHGTHEGASIIGSGRKDDMTYCNSTQRPCQAST